MIAFTFHFPNDPTGADKSLRIGIIAESQEEAWQKIAQKLNFSVDHLREYSPTIQMTELRSGEIIVSRPGTLAGTDDMWPYIVQEGIRDITSVLSERVGSAQDRRFQVELAKLGIDRLVIIVFSTAFLGALAFSFYLIATGNQEPVFNFIFPIITAVIGLISGYFAGRGSAERSP